MKAHKPLVVTAGEPAGIGPELCLLLSQTQHYDDIVVIGDPLLLRDRARQTGIDVAVVEVDADDPTRDVAAPGTLLVIPQRFPQTANCGQLNPANAQTLLDGLSLAIAGCMDGRFRGLVTAPLQKSVINDAGIPFTGHTEFLAQQTNAKHPVMLLVCDELRVALASTHLPLRDVAD